MILRARRQRSNNPSLPLNGPQPPGPYGNGGGAAPILGGMPEKGATQPPLVHGPLELHNQAFVQGPPELQNQAIAQGLPELQNQPFVQRPPELHNQAVVYSPPELHNQAITQGPPELQGKSIAQGPVELQNQTISELHNQQRFPELSGAPSSAPPPQHLQGQWQSQPQMQEMWAPPNSNPQGSYST